MKDDKQSYYKVKKLDAMILITISRFITNDFGLNTRTNLHHFAHLIDLPKDLEKDRFWEFQIGNKLSFFL